MRLIGTKSKYLVTPGSLEDMVGGWYHNGIKLPSGSDLMALQQCDAGFANCMNFVRMLSNRRVVIKPNFRYVVKNAKGNQAAVANNTRPKFSSRLQDSIGSGWKQILKPFKRGGHNG